MSDQFDSTIEEAARHYAGGRRADAEALYRRVLSRSPNHPGALNGLGVLALQAGYPGDAVRLIQRALEIKPGSPGYLNNLGAALLKSGRWQDAAAAHRQAIALVPNDASSHGHLGLALRDGGMLADAEAVSRKAISLLPDAAWLHNFLATILLQAGRFDEAAAVLRWALHLDPGFARARHNLGVYHLRAGRPRDALAEFEGALGTDPKYAEAHWHRGVALLTIGDLQRGWVEYDWRWSCAAYRQLAYNLRLPQWDGANPAGKTILLTPEQGMGDMIQFVRYLPLLAERGARVMLVCQRELETLLSGVHGAERVVAAEPLHADPTPGVPRPLPASLATQVFDSYLPLLSLPGRFGTSLQSVPNRVPYLFPQAPLQEIWRQRLAARGAGSPRVGLVWAGRAVPEPERTCGLAALAPLAGVADVQFVSLQTGPPAAEAANPPNGLKLADFSDELRDFADTAALMANLDLVITIDTAAAHLAGALGRPTWTLLKFAADWRWLEDRADSPWYPTMRLFRQQRRGDWASVISRLVDHLKAWRSREAWMGDRS